MSLKNLHAVTQGLAKVGEQMTRSAQSVATVATTSQTVRKGTRLARVGFFLAFTWCSSRRPRVGGSGVCWAFPGVPGRLLGLGPRVRLCYG